MKRMQETYRRPAKKTSPFVTEAVTVKARVSGLRTIAQHGYKPPVLNRPKAPRDPEDIRKAKAAVQYAARKQSWDEAPQKKSTIPPTQPKWPTKALGESERAFVHMKGKPKCCPQ